MRGSEGICLSSRIMFRRRVHRAELLGGHCWENDRRAERLNRRILWLEVIQRVYKGTASKEFES